VSARRMTPAVTASTHAPARRSLRASHVGRRRSSVRSAALVRPASSGTIRRAVACGVVLTYATAPAPSRVGAARALTGGVYAPPVLQCPRSARHGADRPALLLSQELPEGHATSRLRDGHYGTRVHDAVLTTEIADRRAHRHVHRPAHKW
jgi:hypothetical protein